MATLEEIRENGHSYGDEPRGHVWKTDEDDSSEIDIFAYACGEYHNGPRCVNCGYGFCHHCDDGPDHDCPRSQSQWTR